MFTVPYPPYDFTDRDSFPFETVIRRWPVILTGVIDNIYQISHDEGIKQSSLEPKAAAIAEEHISEGKLIIEKVGKLKYDMSHNRSLEPIPDDGEALIDEYNTELSRLYQEGFSTWMSVPWLFAECYLYRLLRSFFVQTKHWRNHDPFRVQKETTFQSSGQAIYQLATTMHELESEKDKLTTNPEDLQVIFKEMIQMCLWGNATDLSMLTHITHDDIQSLQSVGRDAQAARKEYILKDDQDAVWSHISSLKNSKIDFVLDNAGFELFTDFVFADFLVTYTPYVSKVVFHPKTIPWFVSDVTPPDFSSTITSLLSGTYFNRSSMKSGDGLEEEARLKAMVSRWSSYLSSGVFALSIPPSSPLGVSNHKADFWISPWPYWDMAIRGTDVWQSLRDSGLVIFKGDLNYRKLTGDVMWPASTPFATAIGPLAGSFPILSLRTNKANVVTGVDQTVAAKLDATMGEQWRVNGKFALVSFVPRAAQ